MRIHQRRFLFIKTHMENFVKHIVNYFFSFHSLFLYLWELFIFGVVFMPIFRDWEMNMRIKNFRLCP